VTSALDPFRRWAELPNLAVLDSETTGLHGQIVELGIVNGNGETLFSERIKPTCKIEPGAQAIHGISDADLEGLPGMPAHWERLSEIFQTHHVLIYNKGFDVYRLEASMTAALPGWFEGPGGQGYSDMYRPWQQLQRTSECVMLAYAPVYGNWNDYHRSWRWAKLVDACAAEGVETSDLDSAHSAVGDCLRTLRLVQAVAKKTDDSLPGVPEEGEW
jgi:DNA polymerase III epsilon subunit-like protein